MGDYIWIKLLIVGQLKFLSSATEFCHVSTSAMTCSEHARVSILSYMHDQPVGRAFGGKASMKSGDAGQALVETTASTVLGDWYR
jgi:hypothetical protein